MNTNGDYTWQEFFSAKHINCLTLKYNKCKNSSEVSILYLKYAILGPCYEFTSDSCAGMVPLKQMCLYSLSSLKEYKTSVSLTLGSETLKIRKQYEEYCVAILCKGISTEHKC